MTRSATLFNVYTVTASTLSDHTYLSTGLVILVSPSQLREIKLIVAKLRHRLSHHASVLWTSREIRTYPLHRPIENSIIRNHAKVKVPVFIRFQLRHCPPNFITDLWPCCDRVANPYFAIFHIFPLFRTWVVILVRIRILLEIRPPGSAERNKICFE